MADKAPVKLTEDELKAKAAKELAKVEKLEVQLNELEMVLSKDPQFVKFMQFQKAVADKSNEVKKNLERQMIDSNIKSITVDAWGKITIVERQDVKVLDEAVLPKKFLKKSVDSKKLNDHYKLTGELPDGTEVKITQFIKMTPKKEVK